MIFKKRRIDIEDQIELKEEKIRKQSELSLKTIKQLETLKHYFKVNYEKRVITIPIHYKKVSEIFDTTIGNIKHPYIKRDFLISISNILHSIPLEFLIDIDAKFDDYEGYDPKAIISSIKDAFELFHYDVVKEKTRSNLKVAILIFIGFTVLAWLFYLCSKKLIGQQGDPTHDTIHELIYTVGGVVLWEAVYIIFLPDDEYKDVSYNLLWRSNNFYLYDKDNKLLASIDNRSISYGWRIETKKERRARYFLLLSGTTLMCFNVVKIRDMIETIVQAPKEGTTYITVAISLLVITLGVLASLGAISYYRDKGPFKRLVLIFGIIFSIFYFVEFVSIITLFIHFKFFNVKLFIATFMYLIVMILYTICASMLRNKAKKKKKIVKKIAEH